LRSVVKTSGKHLSPSRARGEKTPDPSLARGEGFSSIVLWLAERGQVRHYQPDVVVRNLFAEGNEDRLESLRAHPPGNPDNALINQVRHPVRNRGGLFVTNVVAQIGDDLGPTPGSLLHDPGDRGLLAKQGIRLAAFAALARR